MSDDSIDRTVVTMISKVGKRPVAGDACMVVIYGGELGKKYNLDVPSLIIGRSSKSDIQVDQESVSRTHCKIVNDGGTLLLHDLGSTNGTYVNDHPVKEHVLADGDIVKIGRTIFKFLSGENIEHAYHEEIYRMTTVDGLTEVYNRRYFLEALDRELSRSHRYQRDLSLLMLDIDHFKQINDTFGHVAGDHVLKHLVAAIKKRIRREDVMARYGGEEFAILLPEIDLRSATAFAQKIHRLVERTILQFDETPISVTVSIGIASLTQEVSAVEDLLKRADGKLYEAKRQGRNRVCY